jgi:hypothetical protein
MAFATALSDEHVFNLEGGRGTKSGTPAPLPGGGEKRASQAMPPPSARRSLNTLSWTMSLPSKIAPGP